MELRTARNILISVGAFFLCELVAGPLTIAFAKFTEGTVYVGKFNGYIVMPLIDHLPQALVAGVAGAIVVWLVESGRPTVWAVFLATLYALFGFYGHHWSRPPLALDRLSETIGAAFPALVCFVGGIAATQWLTPDHRAQISPD